MSKKCCRRLDYAYDLLLVSHFSHWPALKMEMNAPSQSWTDLTRVLRPYIYEVVCVANTKFPGKRNLYLWICVSWTGLDWSIVSMLRSMEHHLAAGRFFPRQEHV